MRIFHVSRAVCPLLLAGLLVLLSACTAGKAQDPAEPDGETPVQNEQAEQPAGEPAEETLSDLCGEDYQTYLIETITMQMGNRMDKDPAVIYFPIAEDAPLTDYVAIDETTEFQVNEAGNIVIFFPEGTVTDASHGEQSFIVPRP